MVNNTVDNKEEIELFLERKIKKNWSFVAVAVDVSVLLLFFFQFIIYTSRLLSNPYLGKGAA